MKMSFLGPALSFMIVYVWSKRNPTAVVSFWGFRFQGAYLPWVMLGFSVLVGNSPVFDLMGIAVGHIYYFLQDVLPATTSGALAGKRVLWTPSFLSSWLNVLPTHYPAGVQARMPGVANPAQPARGAFAGQGRVLGRRDD